MILHRALDARRRLFESTPHHSLFEITMLPSLDVNLERTVESAVVELV